MKTTKKKQWVEDLVDIDMEAQGTADWFLPDEVVLSKEGKEVEPQSMAGMGPPSSSSICDIDPPVILYCVECGKPALKVTSGLMRTEADPEWHHPTAEEFQPVKCRACKGEPEEVFTMGLQELCSPPGEDDGKWREYDMLAGRGGDDEVNDA